MNQTNDNPETPPSAPPKALAAMSGGVDSSVAAALALEQGYDCAGVTLKLFSGGSRCCSLEDIEDARAVAFKLGIPHYVLNFTGVFERRVIGPFVETYLLGDTPNPCVECNRAIKWEALLLRAEQTGFSFLITGHYARIERNPSGRYLLKKAYDPAKDQSYVLYMLGQTALSRTIFPLGAMNKAQVRALAAENGFITAAKRDSQDICFVPDGDYGAFIERRAGTSLPEGDIIDPEGKPLGRHRGIARYTIGQRRGLGVSLGEPVYVTAKSAADNTITAGPPAALYTKHLLARRINLIPFDSIGHPLRVKAKTRYLQEETPALAEQTAEDELRVEFDTPQRAVTPGQAVVIYADDYVLGGATIAAAY